MQFCKNCLAWTLDLDADFASASFRPEPNRAHSGYADAPPPYTAYAEAPPSFGQPTYTSYADAPPPNLGTAAQPGTGWAPAPVDNLLWAPPHPTERHDLPAPDMRGSHFADAERELEFEDIEETRLLPHRSRSRFWALNLPDETTELITGSIILGRSATPMPEFPGAKLLSVNDPSRSVSKNHAVFMDRDGILTVEDLQSTNGIVVTRPDGTEIDPGRHGRVELDSQYTVELGELVIRVHQFSGASIGR
jgi:hypothetical protein